MIDSFDRFLGAEEPCACFHDAMLVSLQIHYERRELISEWRLYVGDATDPDRDVRERMRCGRLRLTGLAFWVVEPHDELLDGRGPWLVSDGPLLDAGTDRARELSKLVPPGASAWYLYFSDWNAHAYCSAEGGTFEWIE